MRVNVFSCRCSRLKTFVCDCSEIWGASAVVPLPSEGAIEAELARVHIRCLASGALGDVHKFYFYAEDTSAVLFLVELSLSSTSNRFSALVKSAAQDKGSAFADIIKRALRDFILL